MKRLNIDCHNEIKKVREQLRFEITDSRYEIFLGAENWILLLFQADERYALELMVA